jgi:hypothetical protein
MEMSDVIKVEKLELVKTKDLCSKIVFLKDNSLNMVMLNFKNNEQKHLMRKKALELIHKLDVEIYWFSSTAWFLTQEKDGKNLYKRPSRDVNRKECFMVTEFRKDRKNKVYFAEIKRDMQNDVLFIEDEKTNSLLNKQDNMQSYWDAWADEQQMDIENKKMIEENNEKFIKNASAELIKKHSQEIANAKTSEDFAKIIVQLAKEAKEKINEENKTLLEDPEEFED